MLITIVNDERGWLSAYQTVHDSISQEKNYTIRVSLPNDLLETSANVLELCYLFPLADYILQKGKTVAIHIRTEMAAYKAPNLARLSTEQGPPPTLTDQARTAPRNHDIRERLKAFLQAQICRFHGINQFSIQIDDAPVTPDKVLFQGEPLSEKPIFLHLSSEAKEQLIGALLLSGEKSADGTENREIYLSHELTDEEKDNLKISIDNLVKTKYGKNYKLTFKTVNEISRIAPIMSVGAQREDSSIFLGDLIKNGNTAGSQNNLQLRYLYNVCYKLKSYLEDWEHFKGSESPYNITKQKKQELAASLKQYIQEKLPSMNLLNKTIWLYILRDLQESKELVKFVKDTNGKEQCFLDMELLEKSHLNAVSYAEGLYQLIENACLYSNGKRAYWGMRMYRSRMAGGVKETLRRATVNKALYEKYRLCALTKTARGKDGKKEIRKVSSNNIFTKNYSHLLEFYVIDEAMTGKGILVTSKKQFQTIEDLIADGPSVENEDWDNFSNEIANHYGLRVFCKILERNDGYIIVRSPCSASEKEGRKTSTLFRRFQNDRHDESAEQEESYTTSFHIIAPLLPVWNVYESAKSHQFGVLSPLNPRTLYQTVCVRPIFNEDIRELDAEHKVEEVNRLVIELKSALQKPQENTILTVDMREMGMYATEMLAKALFRLAIQRRKDNAELHAAVLFSESSNEPMEFVRIFASFYDKMAEGKEISLREILRTLQIAVCSSHHNNALNQDSVEVSFILSGDNPALAYESVRNYLYMNFSSSIRFIPLLRYFAYNMLGHDKSKGNDSWFPFDLYLTKNSFDSSEVQKCDPWQNSLFLDRMAHVLNTDLQEHKDGCRISGIHVRLGSKIHLNTFYEAELLFRSIGNVQGFAYLISNDINERLIKADVNQKKKRIILVGYEKYAAELVTQVFDRLKQDGWLVTTCILPAKGEQQKQCIQLASCQCEDGVNKEHAVLITIIPVGSTMSTIYKVRNIATKYYEQTYDIDTPVSDSDEVLDYCVVAVNHELAVRQSDLDIITKRYWKKADPTQKTVWVKPEKKSGRILPVRYLLSADANWSDPTGTGGEKGCCQECRNLMRMDMSDKHPSRLPLLQVDKTSMIPDSIFKLKNSNLQLMKPKDREENSKRMEKLWGLIRYGHIFENDNHFQFHFDLKRLFQINEREIKKWMESITINRSAFHIVIAPNDIDCAPFLCAVMEMVFGNSLRFLHLDINQAYREDVRLKFSQVADEYKHLRQEMPNVPFCVYYLSETVSSTRTISRSQLLVRMLLNESGLNEVSDKFTKIILLLCRSSFDTMKQFVRDPSEDVEAWLTLNIPPYNMLADRCPACELLGKYALLRKRSSTKTVSEMFERLEEKHAKRTYVEYDQWLLHETIQSHSYYAWFKQWVFFHCTGNRMREGTPYISEDRANNLMKAFEREFQKVLSCLPLPSDVTNRNPETCLKYLKGDSREENEIIRNSFRLLLSKRTMTDYLSSYQEIAPNENLDEHSLAELVRDTVVAARNYRRLVCLQEAYETLILLSVEGETVEEMNQKLDQQAREAILKMIGNHLYPDPNSREEFAENAEWIISFIKVLSRELLVKYYHIHRAVINLMYDMLAYINYGGPVSDLTESLEQVCKDWSPILRTLRFDPNIKKSSVRSEKTALYASLQYEIFMTLVHRLSVLQCGLVYEKESVEKAAIALSNITKKYFGIGEYHVSDEELYDALMFTEMPPNDAIRNRYIKSVKTATMLTSNDDPCYRMAQEMRGDQE